MADANLASLPGFTVVSNTVLAALEKKINNVADYATLDLSAELANGGETATAHYVSSVPTVTAKTSAGYSDGAFGLTAVSVSLGQPIYAQIAIEEVDLVKVSNPRKLEDVIAGAMIVQLGKAIEDKVLALITAGNFAATPITAAAASFDFAGYRAMVASGFKAGYANPVVALGSDHIAKLEATQGFYGRTSGGAYDDGSKLVRSDRIPTAANLVGFVTDKSGLVIAGRALPTPSNTKGSFIVKPTDSGLSVRFGMWYDEAKGKSFMRAELLVGAAVGNPSALIRVVSA